MAIQNKVKRWMVAALVRAVKTVAQTAVAMVPVAVRFSEVDWATVCSTAFVAGLLSILTSVATGLPEAPTDTSD